MSSKKPFHSDPHRDKIVCIQTYRLMCTLKRAGLKFDVPMKEVLTPLSLDGVMLDKFIRAFVRLDDED